MAYIISLDHSLDEKGAIALQIGPARKIAVFATEVVAHASNIIQSQESFLQNSEFTLN